MGKKWKKGIWVELIGFDRTKEDYGVKEYLDRMPEKPELISLLLFSLEMLHTHKDLEKDFLIGDEECSYYGRPCNEERERQSWSAWELRGLVAELKKYSIKVLPSFFDMTVSAETAESLSLKRKEKCWSDEHPEVMYVLKNGKRSESVFPLKHLADGSLYEDFFAGQLLKFLKDYGFSGFHGCDGFGHPRFALCDADFSPDMLEQFTAYTHIALPDLPTEKLAELILENYRKEWSLFHAYRHGFFWKKITSLLKKEGYCCFLNTCWTRDPHEALFRYGIDYRLLADCGIDGFFAEASSAVLELEGWNDTESSCIEKCHSMFLRIKAMVPHTPIWLLGCIKDGMEQYNALRHAPTLMRTEAFTLSNLYCDHARCGEGILECLGDGITAGEWQIVDSIRLLASSGEIKGLPCTHILWDDGAFDKEFAHYADEKREKRLASSHTLLYEFIHAGAILPSILTLEKALEMPKEENLSLLVFHPGFFPEVQLQKLKEKASFFGSIGLEKEGRSFITFTRNGEEIFREEIFWQDPEKTGEPSSWLSALSEKHIPMALLRKAAGILNENSSPIGAAADQEDLRLWCVKREENKLRIFARSEKSVYLNAVISVAAKVKKVTRLTQDPSLPVRWTYEEKEKGNSSLLYAKIPPLGTIILEVETEE